MEVTSSMAVDMQAASAAKDVFGAQVVSKTLDYMNDSQSGANSSSDFDFQTTVLEGAMTGNIINEMV